jgi:4-amino-4-deoxy-L-arabinose transferase-like glycosyltransferase
LTYASLGKRPIGDWTLIFACAGALWAVNAIWLANDTRPPVWDMALHQTYALNYVPGFQAQPELRLWQLSGNYPPFVHLLIAAAFRIFHPNPHIARLYSNSPSTSHPQPRRDGLASSCC